MDEEDGYDATMSCMKEKYLREGLSNVCNLPPEPNHIFTRSGWVVFMLDKLNKGMRNKMMFLWWRAWHHRDN
jgi:hypothetical protein